MSIKFYDNKKQQWEKIASLLASSIKVTDIEGNYDSASVEDCLKEISVALDNKFDDVEYTSSGVLNFYSNGVIVRSVSTPAGRGGDISNEIINRMQKQLDDHEARIAWLEENGGGGGGTDGNTAPTITTTFDQSHFSMDDEIEIPYFVMDSQGGNFIANYSIDGVISTETVKVGPNVWRVGRGLPKGSHTLKLYLKDYALFSNELVFNIVVGSLEITSNFREKDYGLNDSIVVNYDIEAIGNDAIQVERIYDGKSTVVSGTPGRNTWTIGKTSKGPHRFSLRAFTENGSSNILTYNFTVTDSESLYVSTTFEDEIWNVENRLIIPYRVSLMGGSKFKAKYTINGIPQPVADAALGMNFWDLGYPEIGDYELTIQATNVSGSMESNIVTINLTVQATDFTPVKPIEDYLLCWFDAKGKSNKYEDREEWIDKSGNNVQASLVDVNYSNNGWIDDGLRLNGDAYVEIDLQPFASGVSDFGLTLDVQYSYNNSGTDSARVFSCELPILPSTGVSIDSIDMNLFGTESMNKSPNNEENMIRTTFVINPEIQRTYIYVNGVICNTALISNTDSFIHDSKIYLNCRRDINGDIIDLSDCTIYNVRVYDKALSSEEVVQNHISDMKIDEQKLAVKRNTFTSLGQIDFDGDFTGMGADDQVPLRVAFSPNDGPGVKFDYPKVLTDWQGNSSLEYAIKNYNIDLIDEEGNGVDIQMKEDWPNHDSYHIKANMVDSSHAFNLGIAKLLPTIYTEPHPGITLSPDKPIKYAVDGFPITCFHNGKFHGLYTFNLKQHRKVFGMDKESTTQFMYRAEENSAMGAAAFRNSTDFSIEQEFEERHPKRPPGTGVKHNELRRLIDFVKDSSDAVFVRDISKYFNKNYLMDYYLICYAFGGIDSLGKNMTLATWDGTATSGIWYPMFYDMDTFFGFDNKGELVWGPDVRCPEDYNTSGSLLWERVEKLLKTDLRTRYAQIRRGGLNLENVLNVLRGEIIDPIGEVFYNLDATDKYLSQGAKYLYMAKGNRVQHLERWLKSRFLYVDSMFGFLSEAQNSIIVRNTCSGLWKLRIKTYTPQLIKVEFGGTGVGGQEPYLGTLTKMCNNKEWTEFSYFFDGVYQRDISISGAKYIIGLEGVSESETLMLDVSLAEKLIELDCSGNPNLTTLDLSNCVRLKRLDAHNCPRLGEGGNTPLNVGNCYNLKYLDISNTSVPSVDTSKASYLTYVDISNTMIASLNYANLQSLKNLKIENCNRLTAVSIDSCQGITSLTIRNNPALREIRLSNCKNLEYLDISGLKDLNKLILEDCIKLNNIKIRTCASLKDLDLAGCPELFKLDAQSSVLENISFGEIAKLKQLDISKNNKIKVIDFGDCKSKLEVFKINDSENIRTIENINLLISNYEQTQIFRDNDYIQTITGVIEFEQSITSAREFFRGCIDLETVPQFKLNNVNVLANMFQDCSSLENVPAFDTSNIIDMSYMFMNCIGLQEAPAFKTPKVTNFSHMFYNCISLKATPNYDISATKSLQGMFKQCSGLVDVVEMDTAHIENFGDMFMDCESLQYIPDFDTSNATNISYFLDGCIKLRLLPEFDTSKVTNFTRAFSRCESVSFIPPFNTSKGDNLSYMFYGDVNISEIESIDLSSATNISGLFESCIRLSTLPALNTTKVTNFSSLFRSCYELLEIPELDTSNAIDISNMYWDCRNLVSIPPINTTNVTKMQELFYGCASLEQVPEFYTEDTEMESPTEKVTDMRGLFNGCRALTSIPDIDTKNVSDFSEMFRDCTQITSIPRIDVTKAVLASEMFAGCTGLTVTPDVFTTDKSTLFGKCTTLYGMFRGCKITEAPAIDTSKAEDVSGLFENCTMLETVPELNTMRAVYIGQLFRGCEKLTAIPDIDARSASDVAYSIFEGCKSITTAPKLLNISSTLTDISYMYKNCSSLTTISEIKLGSITSINEMFRGCSSLTTIPEFNTAKVTSMSGLFSGCKVLSAVPTNLNTAKVTTMVNMFNSCAALVTIPLLDTSSATAMDSMFANCTGIRTVPEFNTAKVKSFASMFSGCTLLERVPNFDTSSAISTSNMFRNCSNLSEIGDLDTMAISNMSEMFRECTKLRGVPRTILTDGATNLYGLFYGCSSLEELHTLNVQGANGSVSDCDRMLDNCEKLRKCSFSNNKVPFTVSNFELLSDLKFYDSQRGASLIVNNNNSLDSAALDAMFEALAEVEKGTINISGCAGVYGCDVSIAEAKGWTVTADYSLPHPLKRYTR